MFSFRSFFKLGSTSYKDLGKQVMAKVTEHDVNAYAAAMAYYFMFALFPFFLFLTTLIGYLPIPNLMQYIMDQAGQLLPKEAFNLFADNLRALFMKKKGGLLSLGVVLALWSSSSAVTSIMDVMNRIYEVKEGRPFYQQRIEAVLLVFTLAFLFLVSLALLMFGTQIGSWVAVTMKLGNVLEVTWDIATYLVVLFLLVLALAIIYYFTPDVEQEWKWISPGAVVAIPCWIIASLLFAFYINNFGSYDKTYGSIGAVIVLLLWFYISGFIILVGAVINSVIEHSSAEGKAPGEKVEGEKTLGRTG
ncbi:YihY/virulence factor BrkB family protein [Geomesophilobacter sediminis]|uniref:YihY/virulence factor BrkB family protein n=1 Tax=Geomesophilobacter sediminis TaxID=2798584 RepID=A0A8J7JD85_9BACT|nr:YihY/virulence factor BrkB family protein [Geomesophilobacter sediminis]MBJ6725018.1 YihY/virulence factor BrkB family protein [Geomesophilobacter sediminis]